jgi:hypothetical protein
MLRVESHADWVDCAVSGDGVGVAAFALEFGSPMLKRMKISVQASMVFTTVENCFMGISFLTGYSLCLSGLCQAVGNRKAGWHNGIKFWAAKK